MLHPYGPRGYFLARGRAAAPETLPALPSLSMDDMLRGPAALAEEDELDDLGGGLDDDLDGDELGIDLDGDDLEEDLVEEDDLADDLDGDLDTDLDTDLDDDLDGEDEVLGEDQVFDPDLADEDEDF